MSANPRIKVAAATWGCLTALLTVACSPADDASTSGGGAAGQATDGTGAGTGPAPISAGSSSVAGLAGGGAAGGGNASPTTGGNGGTAGTSSGGLPSGGVAAGGGDSGGGSGGGAGTPGTSSCGPGMVRIPAKGKTFTIGLDANEAPLQGDGKPWACYLGKHQVTFSYDYCVDANLVTQAEFSAAMGFNPSKHQTGDLKLPVDAETWYDAVLYCDKKSLKDGLEPAYSHGAVTLNGKSASNIANVSVDIKKTGYRLPTNAEYEYAERADTVGLYFFSPTVTNNITELGAVYAWYTTNSKGVTQPVGMLKPNPWGLYDIIGNLFEWEHDWDGQYPTTPETDPTGLAKGQGCDGSSSDQKMAKGGSWHTDVASHMRIGYHYRWSPSSVHAELGFRCVATLK
jgi:formylglycine-generating enzyme required for sulfatase activity